MPHRNRLFFPLLPWGRRGLGEEGALPTPDSMFRAWATSQHGAVHGAGCARQDRGMESENTRGATGGEVGGRAHRTEQPAALAGAPVVQRSKTALPSTRSRRASARRAAKVRVLPTTASLRG